MSGVEFENLEQKYLDVKSKWKKALHYNDKYTLQIQKLAKKLQQLEAENEQLLHQVQQQQRSSTRDSSDSELSSSNNLQQERSTLLELVHSKNQQITDLLKEIENAENENVIVKEKLTEVKDQLAVATTEICEMTEAMKTLKQEIEEQKSSLKKLSVEVEALQNELQACRIEKQITEDNLKRTTEILSEKELEWKVLLDQKEGEIKQLKSLHLTEMPRRAGIEHELIDKNDKDKKEAYRVRFLLEDTEIQLDTLKKEMTNCTKELRDSAKLVKKINEEKTLMEQKIATFKENDRDMKEQLRKAQDRCQSLQAEVEFANKVTKSLENDFLMLKNQVKNEGQAEMISTFEEMHALKIEKLLHEKQIVGLVRESNKLQEMCNILEMENSTFREQLGVSTEEPLEFDSSILTKLKRQTKLVEKLQVENKHLREDKIKLILENKSLKKQVDSLVEASDSTKAETMKSDKKAESPDIKALSEENEALRKGLHEILNCVKTKNESSPREIKSDILERLLKALDVKHISGWYHPAMRMQAELHALQGANNELREQLHETRAELNKTKSIAVNPNKQELKPSKNTKNCNLEMLLSNDEGSLERIRITVTNILTHLMETETDVQSKLRAEFERLKAHVELLHKPCNDEKLKLQKVLKEAENNFILDVEEIGTNDNISREELKLMVGKERQKVKYLFQKLNSLEDQCAAIRADNLSLCTVHVSELDSLLQKNAILCAKLLAEDVKTSNGINAEICKSLNECIRKYRELLNNVEEQKTRENLDLQILSQREKDIVKENKELKGKFEDVLTVLYQKGHEQDKNGDLGSLAKQLANMEIQAISEKQRADHTNNLYELVKEQLKNSEEKFSDFSKYGDSLLQKNLSLQERVVQLEDQLILSVSLEKHKELESQLHEMIKEKEGSIKVSEQKRLVDYQTVRETAKQTNEREQEILHLRHEIIDLTATSEEKIVIDQLYCDLAKSRSEIREHQLQIDFLRKEVLNWESRYTKLWNDLNVHRNRFKVEKNALDKKIKNLHEIVLKQRLQYHGSVPATLQEVFIDKLLAIHKESHQTFLALYKARSMERQNQKAQGGNDTNKSLLYEDDDDNQQILYLKNKIEKQEQDLQKLEAELFSAYKLLNGDNADKNFASVAPNKRKLVQELTLQMSFEPKSPEAPNTVVQLFRSTESQTDANLIEQQKEDKQLAIASVQINSLQLQLSVKEGLIAEKERTVLEKDKELIEARNQIKLKIQEISVLEKKLRENTKATSYNQHDGAGDGAKLKNTQLDEQILSLKASLHKARESIKQKDNDIIKYQTLLKEDRDKHSLAAANLQKELLTLMKTVADEQQKNKCLHQELATSHQKSLAVEEYVTQVKALEKHLAELHTKLAQQDAQLLNAHQEANRWRQMAQDRLVAMQELGKSLNEKHRKELSSYKTDYEKLKELSEDEPAKNDDVQKGFIDPDILKLCREKDQKIDDLLTKLKQIESGETTEKEPSSSAKTSTHKELEVLRGKYESVVTRERNLKDELRDLKEQLTKRSNSSARSQRSERTVKEQLQKKVAVLEAQVDNLNEKLFQQLLINEKHKISVNEDYEKWKKQKYWQENCEKYKTKLQEREEEIEKLKETCSGYRALIERLEREKISLENRIKSLKMDHKSVMMDQEGHLLRQENHKLSCELESLRTKIEVLQQGSGALGAALMQEKLEAQERKIAVLELSTKGNLELRNELERLQASLANVQKTNLCLEAENLDLKLDAEQYRKEVPHLQEQMHHLENYIELLKSESEEREASARNEAPSERPENKKVGELERTVFILKRVVEKLQVENKRLISGKRPLSERPPSAEKLRRDHLRLKEQYTESLQKIKQLEAELSKKVAKNNSGKNGSETLIQQELAEVKEQLLQKTQLLEKVKSLLHAAAAREKQLLKELSELKLGQGNEKVVVPSPIEEISEVSSDS